MVQYIIEKKGRIGFITPIPQGALAVALEKNMMYTLKNAQFFPNRSWADVKLYRTKTGKFPIGLLSKVKSVFDEWCKRVPNDSYVIKGINNNIKIDETRLANLSPKLRDYQKDAILALIMNNGGSLIMPTGSGKTFTIIEYLKYMNMKTLVLVPTINLVKQWKEQVPDFVDVST